MANRKKKQRKIEKKKAKPFVQFRFGTLCLLILLSFLVIFGLYMLNATSQPDYWEKEILGSLAEAEQSAEKSSSKRKISVTNPVPESRMEDASRMSECAFIGDVSALTAYYETKAKLVFTDSAAGMSESRMESISRNVSGAKAVYFWYDVPEQKEETLATLRNLAACIREEKSSLPLYVLTAVPGTDSELVQVTDDWNTALFALADEVGLHYVDINTALRGDNHTLSEAYRNDEEALYGKIGELILTHIDDKN